MTALDTYQSLREEINKLPKVGTVQKDDEYVTTGQLQKFGEELKSSVTQSMYTKFDEVMSLLKEKSCIGRSGTNPKLSATSVISMGTMLGTVPGGEKEEPKSDKQEN